MKRHVETTLPPRKAASEGEACGERYMREGREQPACAEVEMFDAECCHGGHGRHTALPRAVVRWTSSSQAGLASFRPDPWGNDPDRTTRRETFA